MFKKPELRTNYIGISSDWDTGNITVFTRDGDTRLSETFQPEYYFYSPDPEGEYMSMSKEVCSRFDFDSKEEYEQAKRLPIKKFESDISPVDRVLIDKFYGLPTPVVNFAFLDIETDYKTESFDSSFKVRVRKRK